MCSLVLQAGGQDGGSALRLNERNILPPQMVDYGEFDDVIEIRCEELKGFIKFAGTRLDRVVKVRVDCICDTKENKFAKSVHYEDLWFRAGDPVGSKRERPLPIKECDQVGIFVKTSLGLMSEAEIEACAACLVFLRLELTLNRNLIVTIRIPNHALEGMVSALRKQNFYRYDEIEAETESLIPIQLETDLGRKEVMCFRK